MSTATLNSEKKKALVPELRFFGFEDEWKEKKIGKVFKINAGGDIDNERVSFEKTEKFKYPIYANAKKDKGFYGYSDIYKIESGTITVAGRGVYIGIAHARDHQYYPIVRLLVLKPLANEDIYFSENVINRLNLFVESTGVPQLTAPQFSNYKISLPSLPEQQKIASFLSAVDEKLQQLSRKKELLEQYKKGVMQQLFSGKLRFKDENGNDYADWEEKKLGDVAKLQGGFAFKSELFLKEGIPIIRISNISNNDNYINLNNLIYYKEIENSNNFTIKKGDLILAMSGATTGKSSIYNLHFDAYLNQRVGLFKSKTKELYYSFLIQFVFSEDFQKQLDSVLVAGAQPNVSSSDIELFNLKFPCIEEQQKIADFLSSIDVKIESTNQQLNKTQNFKKGLLQQLFV